MRVFVAGATGAIGRRLVHQLTATGHEVVGMTRSSHKAAALSAVGGQAGCCRRPQPQGSDGRSPGRRAPVSEWLPALADAVGGKPPLRVPVWLGRLAVGDPGVSMMARIRGASNAKAGSDLDSEPRYKSWREGFEPASVNAFYCPVLCHDLSRYGQKDISAAMSNPASLVRL